MKVSREHGIVFGLVLVLIAAVSFMISWSGDEDNIARELQEEPEVSVYLHETGQTRVMPLEEYIQGVVAGEMFPDWPVEAYAAQAIFARSFTMDFIAGGGLQQEYGTDVSTNIEEVQAYNAEAITPEIQQGVEMTRGQVMTYDNRYVRGWFHAYSGGITAQAEEGLDYQGEEPPFTQSVEFPENEFAPDDVTQWTAEYSASELQNLLGSAGVDVGTIENVQITERGPSERITMIEIQGSGGTQQLSGPRFRLAVDSTKMRSTLVNEFSFANGTLSIRGKGYGHGVGLSQWDAFKMAKEGSSPEQIVSAFFQDIEIMKLYP